LREWDTAKHAGVVDTLDLQSITAYEADRNGAPYYFLCAPASSPDTMAH